MIQASFDAGFFMPVVQGYSFSFSSAIFVDIGGVLALYHAATLVAQLLCCYLLFLKVGYKNDTQQYSFLISK